MARVILHLCSLSSACLLWALASSIQEDSCDVTDASAACTTREVEDQEHEESGAARLEMLQASVASPTAKTAMQIRGHSKELLDSADGLASGVVAGEEGQVQEVRSKGSNAEDPDECIDVEETHDDGDKQCFNHDALGEVCGWDGTPDEAYCEISNNNLKVCARRRGGGRCPEGQHTLITHKPDDEAPCVCIGGFGYGSACTTTHHDKLWCYVTISACEDAREGWGGYFWSELACQAA